VIISRFSSKSQERLNDELLTAVSEAVGREAPITAIDEALRSGANPNVVVNLGDDGAFRRTPLEIAAGNGNLKPVNLLLRHHANPNIVGTRGTALHAAVESGGQDVFETLIQHGANINAVGLHGESPVLIAAAMGKSRIVARLLSLKANLNLKDTGGKSALDLAKEENRTEVIAMLHKAGAK
jgi:FOG: Ankyrin repeat